MKVVLLIAALALCVGACKKIDPQPDQSQGPTSGPSVTGTLPVATNVNDAPCCLWKDAKTGCWYIIQSGSGGLTPEMQADGKQVCEGGDTATPDPAP